MLTAYTGLAAAYIAYLLPLAFGAVSGVLRNYPPKAQATLASLVSHAAQFDMAGVGRDFGNFINISIWPAILGVVIGRLGYKLLRRTFLRVRSALHCIVTGSCHCEPEENQSGGVEETATGESKV